MKSNVSGNQSIDISFMWENGHLGKVITNSPPIDHFLGLIKNTRSYNTWVNYAHDLKVFFTYVPKPPKMISRKDCVEFIMQQDKEGCSDATINRRLACLSSFFNELILIENYKNTNNPYIHG